MLGGKKCGQDDVPHEEECPHQWTRSHASDNVPENTDNAEEDEDAQSLLPGDFLDAEDLYDALQIQFKAGPGVKFYGTYPIIEDDLIVPKEAMHQVAHKIW